MSLLGFDAIGRFALGQVRQDGQIIYVLVADTMATTVNVNPATLKTTQPADVCPVAVAFPDVPLRALFPVAPLAASIAFNAATFKIAQLAQPLSVVVSFVTIAAESVEMPVDTCSTVSTFNPAGLVLGLRASPLAVVVTFSDVGTKLTATVETLQIVSTFYPAGLVVRLPAQTLATAVDVSPAAVKITLTAETLEIVNSFGEAPGVLTGTGSDPTYGGVGHYLYEQAAARKLAAITRNPPRPVDRRTAPTFQPLARPYGAPIAPAPDVAAIQNQRMADAAARAKTTKQRRELEAILLLAS